MPETYYYATGSEVTSIAEAIRDKGGTSEPLIFPDDFVQAIEDLHPEPTIAPLTVKPKGRTYKHPIGYQVIDYIYVNDPGNNVTFPVDLSEFSNGNTCYINGELYTARGAGTVTDTVDMSGSFVWSNNNVYTKGIFTLTITSSSVTISANSTDHIYASVDNEIGNSLIGFCKEINCDGFAPVTVNNIPISFVDVSNVTATAADIVSGKTAGLINVANAGYIGTGTLVIQHYYTGTSEPSSSLGQNGDIYLKT